MASNGSFNFPDLLAPGTSYSVRIMVNPLQHMCDFESGRNGKVADIDVMNVVVACTGPAVTVTTSPWDWSFDPTQEMQRFAGSVVMQRIAMTLSGESLTSASVNGNEVMLGAPTELTALPLGATTVLVGFTALGGLSKTYELVLDRGRAALDQVAYAKASNTDFDDHFGYSMALFGDTLVIGAPGEASAETGVEGRQQDNTAPNAGAVYVFVRNDTQWEQQAYLKASNTDAGDLFGYSVALYGDTLAVGAYGEASSATGVDGDQTNNNYAFAGAVYVFVRNRATWKQQAYLKASNTDVRGFFGYSVAGYEDALVVGAYGEASAAGAAYVFVRNDAQWKQQAYLKASNTDAGDLFGYSVALYGETLAVGAEREDSASTGIDGDQTDNSAESAGAVYVFVHNDATWTQQAYLKASHPSIGVHFGHSVTLYENTLAVGAYLEASAATGVNGNQVDSSAAGAGAAYVFKRNGATWEQQAYLKASNTASKDNFGYSVALYGDTLAVGAPGEARGAGAVYVFQCNDTAWAQQACLKASNTEAGDSFGASVTLHGNALVVGAQSEASGANRINGNQYDNSTSSAGATYVFR